MVVVAAFEARQFFFFSVCRGRKHDLLLARGPQRPKETNAHSFEASSQCLLLLSSGMHLAATGKIVIFF
jgi:hypothetical protein